MSDSPAVVLFKSDGTEVQVDSLGRLSVATLAPSAPTGTVAINQQAISDMKGTKDKKYTIPSGKSGKILRFAGGSEGGKRSAKVELWWAPDGSVNNNAELIRVGYVFGNNFDFALDYDFPLPGNGTRAIILRRKTFDNKKMEIAGFWDGWRDA